MKTVAIIVTLVCCLLMFFVKREWKVAMLVMGAMTLTLVDIPGIPLHKANLLLQVAFLLSAPSGSVPRAELPILGVATFPGQPASRDQAQQAALLHSFSVGWPRLYQA